LNRGTIAKRLDDGRKQQSAALGSGQSLTSQRIKCVESTLIARVGPFADCRHFLEIARQLGQRGLHVKVDGCACKL
jgi:hypothetical protein